MPMNAPELMGTLPTKNDILELQELGASFFGKDK